MPRCYVRCAGITLSVSLVLPFKEFASLKGSSASRQHNGESRSQVLITWSCVTSHPKIPFKVGTTSIYIYS